MELSDLKKHHKKFHDDTKLMYGELLEVVKKWLKKDPRTTMVNMMNLPLNLTLNLLVEAEKLGVDLGEFDDLPNIYIRTMKPFEELQDDFLKIPMEEFAEKYGRLYEAQFEGARELIKNMLNEE